MSSRPENDSKLDQESDTFKRSQMNKLIMDYLVIEGFQEAAEKFNLEAGVEIERINSSKKDIGDFNNCLKQRIQIREAIDDGKIKSAINLINQYYPELLDQNRNLYFKLQQQHLIEYIREGRTEEALAFAQDQLNVDEEYLDFNSLERTLALLAFDKPETSPYSDLLEMSHRQELGSYINQAILMDQSGSATTSHISSIFKLLVWSQAQLESKKIKFPKMVDFSNALIK